MDHYLQSYDPTADHKQFVSNFVDVLTTRGYAYDTAMTLLNVPSEFGAVYDGPILVFKRLPDVTETQKKTTARDDNIYVWPVFCQTGLVSKMGVNHVRSIASAVGYMLSVDMAVNHILIVHGSAANNPNGVTPAATTELMRLFNNNPAALIGKVGLKQVYYETFSYKQFLMNPIMWPYEVVSAPASGNMNYMLWTDVQRRWHDWPPGTVVSRSRQRGSLCEDTSVRIVREP